MEMRNSILIKTEHPKFSIHVRSTHNILLDNDIQEKEYILNYYLFTYINSKFVYVEKHFMTEISDLYLNILKEKCELQRNVYNSLFFALTPQTSSPSSSWRNPGT